MQPFLRTPSLLRSAQVRLLGDYNIKLDGCDLEELPQQLLTKGGKVRELNLARNRITTLPPEIAQLSCLRTLKLDLNGLNTLPAEIGLLSELQVRMQNALL